jgi:exopolysaccharide biosynthesis WecB/TagA/CpsF family protein
LNVHSSLTAATGAEQRPILGIPVASLEMDEAIDLLQRRIAEKRFTRVGFLNAHIANIAFSDPRFAGVLHDFLVLADGVGVDIAARVLHGERFPANLNGTDLVPKLLARTAKPLTVALVGAKRENAERAAAELARRTPQHRIVLVSDGFFSTVEERGILEQLTRLKPDILLVALGVPKQEFWIAENIGPQHCTMPFAVGALLDFLSGSVPRAPGWVRAARLEWMFRLALEPARLWRRYLVGNPLFLLRTLHEKVMGPGL